MKQSYSVFSVASLEDLRQQLAEISPGRGTRYAFLSLSDPAVAVCSFAFEAATPKKLLECVEREAAGLLSLPAQDVIFDYHVFHSSENRAHGILACVPRPTLEAYIHLLHQNKFIVVCAMPAIVVAANTFFHDHKNTKGRVCLLNVTPSRAIQCVIFLDGRCELLRDIRFENPDATQRDVVQTLKSVYAGSASKKFDHIFAGGHMDPEIPIGPWMEEHFQIRPQAWAPLDATRAICGKRHKLDVNLSREYSVTLHWRRRCLGIMNSALVALFAVAIFMISNIYYHQYQARKLKSSFDAALYAEALELERLLR